MAWQSPCLLYARHICSDFLSCCRGSVPTFSYETGTRGWHLVVNTLLLGLRLSKNGEKMDFSIGNITSYYTQQSLHAAFYSWLQCHVQCRVTQHSWRKGEILCPSHRIQFPIHTTWYDQDILHWQNGKERKKNFLFHSSSQGSFTYLSNICFGSTGNIKGCA